MAVDLLSVLIPTRNRAERLAEQLTALTHQTYSGPWEVIVIDNGSTDRTVEVVKQFENQLPIRLLVDGDHHGPGYARNRGAAIATGDYLLFLDDDDRATAGWLDAMARGASEWDIIRGTNHFIHTAQDGTEKITPADYEGLPRPFDFLPGVPTCNCGIRTKLFTDLGGFNERYRRGEDYELFWRAQLAAGEAHLLTDAIVQYRLRSGDWAVVRQIYYDNLAGPMLYRDFRANGMPGIPTRRALIDILRILKHIPRSLRSDRLELCKELAYRTGRIVGSIRNRVLYL